MEKYYYQQPKYERYELMEKMEKAVKDMIVNVKDIKKPFVKKPLFANPNGVKK